jgi:hypothetical protein
MDPVKTCDKFHKHGNDFSEPPYLGALRSKALQSTGASINSEPLIRAVSGGVQTTGRRAQLVTADCSSTSTKIFFWPMLSQCGDARSHWPSTATCVYIEDEPGPRIIMQRLKNEGARGITANLAKLPEPAQGDHAAACGSILGARAAKLSIRGHYDESCAATTARPPPRFPNTPRPYVSPLPAASGPTRYISSSPTH